MRCLFLFVFLFLSSASIATSAQLLTATPSRHQLYWNKPFTIDLTVAPPESLADFEISVTCLPGFFAEQLNAAMPGRLAAGSSYTAKYEITPPSSGHATTETYSIVFNVGYHHGAPDGGDAREQHVFSLEPKMWQSVEVPFTATFSREKFYAWAIAGLFVGWFIKTLGSLSKGAPPAAATPGQKRKLLWLTQREIAGALTSFAMGFLVLLLLSRHEIPTGAIHDSLALGIGLGFLTDDQLLTRIGGAQL